ncbi:alpha/beta hydrolase [Prauserella flavalba]|uniref:alpha/beta hydrolase n=1 Tax=Prauserella flavalba TaxID=1477506 RepID=UPI000D75DB21|nr:alpha/beta hydrolase [Prauserella flavalba]
MRARTLGYAVAGSAAVLGAAVTSALRRQPEPWPSAPGELVEAGGEALHALVRREGSGPTVVFESALSCPCTEWAWVLRALDGATPSVAYDRPGNGWSSRNTSRVDAAEYAGLTRELLEALDLPGPYLFVGHSVGGLLIRAFADRYPADTAGLVFVDSSHPEQLERSSLQREGVSLVQQGINGMCLRTRFRLLAEDDAGFGALNGLPVDVAKASTGVMRRPEPWLAARHEFALWNTRWAGAARQAKIRRGLPVGVVTAGRQATTDLAHGRMQAELAGLSDVSRHEVVKGAEHDSLVMDGQLARSVAEVVRWALAAHREREVA